VVLGLGIVVTHHGLVHDRLAGLGDQQVGLLAFLKVVGGKPGNLEGLLIESQIKLAVTLEGGHGCDGCGHLILADLDAQFLAALGQQHAVDQTVQCDLTDVELFSSSGVRPPAWPNSC